MNKLYTIEALPKKVQPQKWLIPDILVKNDLTLLCASGATGKTTLTCYFIDRLVGDMALNIAYMSFEDNADALKRKLVGLDRYTLNTFRMITLRDQETGARVVPNIMDDEEYAYLKETLEENKTRLLIVDPISALLDGDVNDNMAVRNLIGRLTALAETSKISILGIHHVNKAGYGSINKAFIMGAASWTDVPRHTLMLTKDEDTGARYLTVGKTNCDPEEESWEVLSVMNEYKTYVVTDLVACELPQKLTSTQGKKKRIPPVILALKEEFDIGQAFTLADVDRLGNRKSFYNYKERNPGEFQEIEKDSRRAWIFI